MAIAVPAFVDEAYESAPEAGCVTEMNEDGDRRSNIDEAQPGLGSDHKQVEELAFELEPPYCVETAAATGIASRSQIVNSSAPGPMPLDVANRVLEVMVDLSPASLSQALCLIAHHCKALGGAVGRWEQMAEPIILAASGEPLGSRGRPETYKLIGQLFRNRPADANMLTAFYAGNPALICAGLVRQDREILYAVLWGALKPDCEEGLKLLLIFLQGVNKLTCQLAPEPKADDRPITRGKKFPPEYIPGQAKSIQRVYEEIEMIAPGDFPVLIIGETGVGKEYIARLLHLWSGRSERHFIAVNCAAIPAELLEAEMFGIGRGIATGVLARRGKFQNADGGTLFLDEIGEMPLALQAKLLRALESKEVEAVGGKQFKADVRVIAATNADLLRRAESNLFRADLYYRLAGYRLSLPPLREHKEDIATLVLHFIRLFSPGAGKWIKGITVKALESLNNYPWPGNVRELQQEVRRLVYMCPHGSAIHLEMLPPHLRFFKASGTDPASGDRHVLLEPQVAELERILISRALSMARGNKSQAAKLLGITRNGLACKMERLKLPPDNGGL